MTCIIAFDPGKTTGYAVGEWREGKDFYLVEAGEVQWDDRLSDIDSLLLAYEPNHVVIESFRLYAHRAEEQIGNEFPAVRVIGAIEALLHANLLQPLVTFQPAVVRKSVKILDSHKGVVGASPHSRDAYRHLRYFVIMLYKGKI